MFIVGELINGMYKEVGKAISGKNKKVIQDLAKRQFQAGACALDLNCGPASKDPVSDMIWLIESVQEVCSAILCLDSTKPNVIEEGLKIAKSKTMINSTQADKEKMDILIPMAKKYNSLLIAITMDKRGVPQNKDQRIELAANIISACEEHKFFTENLFLDPVVLPVNVAQNQGVEILQAIREFELLCCPKPKTIVGLSNVSQGTKNRSLINRTFLVMAVANGLEGAILDPLDKELMDALISSELILNKHIYCDSFLDAYRKK